MRTSLPGSQRHHQDTHSTLITTIQHLHQLVDNHPYLRDRSNFPNLYHTAQAFLSLQKKQNTKIFFSFSQNQLANHYGVHQSQISFWLNGKKQPRLFRTLISHENARVEHKAKLAPEAHNHCIDARTVYHTLRPLCGHPERHNPTLLATTIASLYYQSDTKLKVIFAELRPYHERGPTWLRQFAHTIHQHRHPFETHLNTLLNTLLNTYETPYTKIRLGVVNNVLYLWHENTNPQHWLNLWNDEIFHFKNPDFKNQLVENACRHLGFTNETDSYTAGISKFSRLIGQYTNRKHEGYEPLPELRNREPFLHGEVLHIILDAVGTSFDIIKPEISHIGFRDGGFVNDPKFPNIEILQARLLATMLSDGHLDEKRVLYYVERDFERRQRVKNLLDQLGHVQYNEENDRLRIPVPIGRLLENLGMPVGDKAQQQIHLPETIKNGSNESKIAYLQELIPEDGSFHNGIFSWSRSIVMVSPSNLVFENRFDKTHIDLIRKHGTEKVHDYGFEGYERHLITISVSKLQSLKKNENPETSQIATEMLECIKKNPPFLLKDEVNLAKSLGINVNTNPRRVSLYAETGRVSVGWTVSTSGYESSIRWGLIAPPNHERKRQAFATWIARTFVKSK